jgi:sialidase-1
MRQPKAKGCRAVAVSRDGGVSWSGTRDDSALVEPCCQASAVSHPGGGRQAGPVLLFSNPAHPTERRNMTVRLSRDDGRTWPVARPLYEGRSMYSCLTVLPDKTVGLLYEKERNLTFARFSLEWVAAGAG